MRKLVILATGASINTRVAIFKQLFKDSDVDTIAWGDTFPYFVNKLKTFPTYWWFIDPHASLNGLRWISKHKPVNCKTTLHLCKPILTKTHNRQKEYIGAAGHAEEFQWSTKYNKYKDMVSTAGNYLNIQRIEATSFKKQNLGKYTGLIRRQQLMSTNIFQEYLNKYSQKQFCIMNVYGLGRLSSYILPLILFLTKIGQFTYKNIYLAGFDGKNYRWNRDYWEGPPTKPGHTLHSEQIANEKLEIEYKVYMRMWKELCQPYNINLFTLTPSPMNPEIPLLSL